MTGVPLIFFKSPMLRGGAGASGASAAHIFGYFMPKCHVPPPPMEWPIR